MRKLFLLLPAILLGMALCSCEDVRTEHSGVLTEDGRVEDVIFTPATHGTASGVAPTITLEGDMGITIVSADVETKASYAIVFT